MRATFRPLRKELWDGEFTDPAHRRSRWTFKASWSDTLGLLHRELSNLGAKDFVIEADFSESDIRLDGMPRASARLPQFPGVRVAFDSKHGPLVYQTDTCHFWQHNIRSIALGLEALRAVDRYGITHRAEQYTGFKALPPGAASMPAATPAFTTVREAMDWLHDERQTGIRGANGASLKSVLRMVARRVHPDYGGSREDWDKFQAAEAFLKEKGVLKS